MTKRRDSVFAPNFKLFRGLSSFEARAIALILLVFIVFPTLSQASSKTPNVTIEIVSGNSTVRGSSLNVTTLISGTPGNVSLMWVLPTGFEMSVGNTTDFCKTLPCQRNVTLFVNVSAYPGQNQIGVEAKYA